MRLFQRKRYFVDPRVQTTFLVRIVCYWFFGLLAISELILAWNIFTGPDASFLELLKLNVLWTDHASVFVASLFVLAFVLFDVVRLTNRLAGPMFRMRRLMGQLARGERVEKIEFREKDFWQDFATEFNNLIDHVEHLRTEAKAAASRKNGTCCTEQPSTLTAAQTFALPVGELSDFPPTAQNACN